MMITVVVADGSTTVRRDTEQCNCRLLFLIILMSLFFGYVLSHSVPHSGQRFREQFDAQKEPACGTDPWSCDLARAEFLLRFGRSCPNDSSIEPVEHRDLQSSSRTTPSSQCLVLSNSSAKTLCHQEPNRRRLLSRRLTLTFCHKYSLNILTRRTDWLSQEDPLVCQSILEPEIRSLMHRDLTASTLFCEFDVLLSRYNCHTNYSVVWNCSQCRETYKDWMCSTALRFYVDGRVRKPCRSICERVEQRCPYFHPHHKDQYAGEPAFICIDPMIPFVSTLTPEIPYGVTGSCYDVCDLQQNLLDANCTTSHSHTSSSSSDWCPKHSSTTTTTTTTTTTRTTQPNHKVITSAITSTTIKEPPASEHIVHSHSDLMQDQEESDSDDEGPENDPPNDEEVDEELENSSTLTTTGTIVRLKGVVRVSPREKS